MKLTDEELDRLSDEEREALESEDEEVEDASAEDDLEDEDAEDTDDVDDPEKDKGTGKDDADKGDPDPDKKSDDSTKDSTVDKKKEEAEAGDEQDQETKPDDKPAEPPLPFVPKFPEVDQKTIDDLKAKLDEAEKEFDGGAIDHKKFQEAKDNYNKAVWKAEIARESNEAIAENVWQSEQQVFFNANPNFKQNETLNGAFVLLVNKINATPEGQKMSGTQVLLKAKEQVEKDLGLLKPKEDEKDKEKEKAEAIKKAKQHKADRSKIKADIGDLPSAEDNDSGDEFAWLDKLEGEKFEEAVAKLTPEQLERYENM